MTTPIQDLPKTTDEAYAYINQIDVPTLHDFRVIVYLEAAGQAMYDELAVNAPNEDVRQLFKNNAIEELGHAQRLIEAARRAFGAEIEIPARKDNPYAVPEGGMPLDRGFLAGVVTGELQGEVLYERLADQQSDAEVARLLRLNGREERTHSERVQKALDIMG